MTEALGPCFQMADGGGGDRCAGPGYHAQMLDELIAVTGATGEIGGRVARRLAERGVRQRLIVRDASRAPQLPGAELAQAPGGYIDREGMTRALAGRSAQAARTLAFAAAASVTIA